MSTDAGRELEAIDDDMAALVARLLRFVADPEQMDEYKVEYQERLMRATLEMIAIRRLIRRG